MKNIEIKKSINGKGIFATKDFKRDELVFEVKGKIIQCDLDTILPDKVRDNTFRFDEDNYLSPEGNVGDFLNHSCRPNSKVTKFNNKLYVRTIINVNKGEEILIDYSTIIAKDDVWSMKCKCGEEGCRKLITNIEKLPKDIFKKYVRLRIIPKFILNI